MEKLLLEVDHWKWCDYYFVGSNSVVVKIIWDLVGWVELIGFDDIEEIGVGNS
jgi:hypothetical protein